MPGKPKPFPSKDSKHSSGSGIKKLEKLKAKARDVMTETLADAMRRGFNRYLECPRLKETGMRTILIPCDGSDNALLAVRYAALWRKSSPMCTWNC